MLFANSNRKSALNFSIDVCNAVIIGNDNQRTRLSLEITLEILCNSNIKSMKLKDIFSPVLFIILGIAFLAVSLWVILSRNKNIRAVKYKYKLGGLILSLSFFVSACDNRSRITCYDPVVPDNTIYSQYQQEGKQVSMNDTIFFSVLSPSYNYYSYELVNPESKVTLTKGKLIYLEERFRYILPFNYDLNYTGYCTINIFGEENEDIQQSKLLHSEKFILNATEN